MGTKKKSRYTAAQAKASRKYLEKLADLKIRMTPEQKEKIKESAEKENKSINQCFTKYYNNRFS